MNNTDDGLGEFYTANDKTQFLEDIEEKISTMAGDPAELSLIFYEMYARPLINKTKQEIQ